MMARRAMRITFCFVVMCRPRQGVAEHEVSLGVEDGHCGAFLTALLHVLPFIDAGSPSALDYFKVRARACARACACACTCGCACVCTCAGGWAGGWPCALTVCSAQPARSQEHPSPTPTHATLTFRTVSHGARANVLTPGSLCVLVCCGWQLVDAVIQGSGPLAVPALRACGGVALLDALVLVGADDHWDRGDGCLRPRAWASFHSLKASPSPDSVLLCGLAVMVFRPLDHSSGV
jgi:hypothetical protein